MALAAEPRGLTTHTTPRLCAAAAAVAALGGSLGACDGPRQISDSGFGAYEVSLATWTDSFTVAWYDTRDGNAEVYVRALDAAGKEIGAESRLTDSGEQSFEADIAAAANGFAVAWYERATDGTLRARVGFWDLERRPQWSVALGAAEHESRSPVVRIVGDALFCAWIEKDGDDHVVAAGWWDLAGDARGTPLRLGPASANTWNLNAAVDGRGAPFVVFDALAGTKAHELFVARVEGDRASLARLGADDGFPSLFPDIAFSPSGAAAVTWFDERDGNQEVYLATGPVADLLERFADHERRVTATPGPSIGAYVAWNGERIGLAWSDDSSGSYEIYYRPFDERGDALGAQQRVTDNATDSLIPAIRAWRDGFALAWSEVSPAAAGAHAAETRAEVMFARVR
jgi:hypothetical protein